MWIQDLRELCERSFNDREKGQFEIEEIRLEWQKAHSDGEVTDSLLDGLERRVVLLLDAGDSEWTVLLDNEHFWKAGWGSKVDE